MASSVALGCTGAGLTGRVMMGDAADGGLDVVARAVETGAGALLVGRCGTRGVEVIGLAAGGGGAEVSGS